MHFIIWWTGCISDIFRERCGSTYRTWCMFSGYYDRLCICGTDGNGRRTKSQYSDGKKDNEGAEKILGNRFSALVITAVVLTALVLVFKRPLLMMFGASENTIGYAESYLNIYAVGTIFVQLTLGLNAFIAAQGFSKISMMTVVIGAVTNIVLDPIFIFGFDMGVQGAALATVLSQAISAVWAIRFLSGKDTVLRLKKENFKIKKRSCCLVSAWEQRRLSCSLQRVSWYCVLILRY